MRIDDLLGPILSAGRQLRPDDSTETLPTWDSVKQVEVILAIEEAVGGDLSASEIDNIKSIADIIKLLRARGIDAQTA